MPQMSPLMWLALFNFFILMFFLTSSKIYFNTLPTPNQKTSISKKHPQKNSWVW